MSSDSYDTLHIVWRKRDYYAVYISGDPDRLMMADKRVLFHPDYERHTAWIAEQKIQLADSHAPMPHDFDQVKSWTDHALPPEGDLVGQLFNTWNVLNDINTSIGIPTAFAATERGVDEVYNKLFSADMTRQPDDWLAKRLELETPSWSADEIQILKKVMTEGLAFFDRLLE